MILDGSDAQLVELVRSFRYENGAPTCDPAILHALGHGDSERVQTFCSEVLVEEWLTPKVTWTAFPSPVTGTRPLSECIQDVHRSTPRT